ncbi:MAG: DUF1223 domain-containing protein [Pseudomonadota bacterium]
MKRLLSILSILALATLTSLSAAAAEDVRTDTEPGSKMRSVVELFTSQGCSSCPKADRYLGKLAARDDVIALSWHVDYWNYLGWSDTFSKPEFSDRQRRYAASFKSRNYYTPQMVVNGRDHTVGSQENKVEALLAAHIAAKQAPRIVVNARKVGDELRISVGGDSESKTMGSEATLWLVMFDKTRKVMIERGENAGSEITYHNVVRGKTMLGMVKGGTLDVALPIAELKRRGFDGCALLLQTMDVNGLPGPIIGATVVNSL